MLAIVMFITTEQVKIENFEAVCFVPCSLCGSNLTIKHRIADASIHLTIKYRIADSSSHLTIKHRISSHIKSFHDQAQNQLAYQVISRSSTESVAIYMSSFAK